MIDSSISLVAPEMKIIDDNAIVNIEHILPVDYSLWKDVTIDFHDEYLWRLGNLSLLNSEFNKKCSNYPFEQKKEIYKQSSIEITKKILNYNNWTEKEINERQKYFTNFAVSIWKK